jgi:putative transposase
LIWNQRHLMSVLGEYEDFYNEHRPHCTLNQAAPLRPLPGGVTDLDRFRVLRRDRRFLPGVLATANRTTRVSHDQSHWTREMV